jgi:DNA-binding SARP family transcriptional activator
MAALTLTFLGAFDVHTGAGAFVRIRFEKARALLAYLAVEAAHPHPRPHLAGLLWPEQPDALGLRNLSQTLIRLRAVLDAPPAGRPWLHITRPTIQWNTAGDYQLDVATFMHLGSSTAAADLEQAAALYRGEFLAGFSLRDCATFDAWLLLRREQLQQRRRWRCQTGSPGFTWRRGRMR